MPRGFHGTVAAAVAPAPVPVAAAAQDDGSQHVERVRFLSATGKASGIPVDVSRMRPRSYRATVFAGPT